MINLMYQVIVTNIFIDLLIINQNVIDDFIGDNAVVLVLRSTSTTPESYFSSTLSSLGQFTFVNTTPTSAINMPFPRIL